MNQLWILINTLSENSKNLKTVIYLTSYILGTDYIPDTVLDTKDREVNKTNKNPSWFYNLVEKTDNKGDK